MKKLILSLLFAITLLMSSSAFAYTDKELEEKAARKIKSSLNHLGSQNYAPLESALFFFERMGKEATPHLIENMKENKGKKRIVSNTIYLFGRMGVDARKAVPSITPFLKSKDKDLKAASAIALGKIGKYARAAVPAIANLLADDDEWVRKNALQALERIGTKEAKEAIKQFNAE